MNTGIQVHQNETKIQPIIIQSDVNLTGFTPLMIIDFLTGVTIISGTSIVDCTTIFTIEKEINDVKPYVYEYEVRIEDAGQRFIPIKGSYTVLPSIIN